MDPAAMEGKDEPLEFKRVLDNIRVRIADIIFESVKILLSMEKKVINYGENCFTGSTYFQIAFFEWSWSIFQHVYFKSNRFFFPMKQSNLCTETKLCISCEK